MSINDLKDYNVLDLFNYYQSQSQSQSQLDIEQPAVEDADCSVIEEPISESAYDFLLTSNKPMRNIKNADRYKSSVVYDENVHCGVCKYRKFKTECCFKYVYYIYIYIYGIHMNNNVYLCYDGTTHKQSIFLLYFN